MKQKKFSDKTLLILGSNAGSVDLIKYAKENGAYTIVVDYLPCDKSEAKNYSDDSALISTADTMALEKLIKERHVNGVLSGISEFNIFKAMELSEKCGLKYYCNKSQWDSIEYKDNFRKLCERFYVPCPKTYYIGRDINEIDMEDIDFPVMIKPVDCAASIGVHICQNKKELKIFWVDAINNSEQGEVIIEEYVYGDEFTAHYTICNGKATLSCIDNRYPVAIHEGSVTTIPIARIYPSTYTNEYIDNVNSAMIRLCNSLKLNNAVIFVQGIYNKKMKRFWLFEAGLRSAAELPNRIIDRVNGINYINNIVDYVLLGKGTLDQSKEDPFMKGKSCGIVSFVAKHGIVNKIDGLEEAVTATSSVIDFENRYPVGSITPDTDTLKQLMIRFVMIDDSKEHMVRDIAYLNENITVLNDKGEDMVIKFDPSRMLTEFS